MKVTAPSRSLSHFEHVDHSEPEPRWARKVGVSLGIMAFGNILPLSPKLSAYGKAQMLRNSIIMKTKDSEFRASQI